MQANALSSPVHYESIRGAAPQFAPTDSSQWPARHQSIRDALEREFGGAAGVQEMLSAAPATLRQKAIGFLNLHTAGNLADKKSSELNAGVSALAEAAGHYEGRAESLVTEAHSWGAQGGHQKLGAEVGRAFAYHQLRQQLQANGSTAEQRAACMAAFHARLRREIEDNEGVLTPAIVSTVIYEALSATGIIESAEGTVRPDENGSTLFATFDREDRKEATPSDAKSDQVRVHLAPQVRGAQDTSPVRVHAPKKPSTSSRSS